MGYSSAYSIGRELGFFSWRFLEVKVNSGIGDFEVRGFDSINGINRIG